MPEADYPEHSYTAGVGRFRSGRCGLGFAAGNTAAIGRESVAPPDLVVWYEAGEGF